MARNAELSRNIDTITLMLYVSCVLMGWLNVYAAVYSPEEQTSLFDFSSNAGKQLIWIGTAVLLIVCVLVIDHKFYDTFAFVFYLFMIAMLLLVMVVGTNVNGSRSWFKIGAFTIQPAEFAKIDRKSVV